MSIFDTTANTNQNAFNNPQNPINQNQGAWGMDPNYLTPAFSAPYRPPYSGGGQTTPYPNPGFGRSIYGVNFGSTPYSVGIGEQDSRYWDSLSQKPTDAGMFGAQRIAAPILAWGGALAIERHYQMINQSAVWGHAANSPLGKLFSGGISGGAAKVGFSTGMGQRAFGGLAKGLIGGANMFSPGLVGAGAAAAGIETATFIGGAIGFATGSLAMAQAVLTTADKAIFEPYTAARENQNMLRDSFSGVTFDRPGVGDSYTGKGIRRGEAARMGGRLAQLGMKDQTFDSREVATLTSMAAQSGLLDNVQPEQMAKRMQSLITQLKTVMSVTGSTDFKEVMTMMAKLQMAGVAPYEVGTTMTRIGALSSAAGISANRMMNTVGAQGQYIFQANGLTPYLGQIAAASSMAGMATAFRTGLVSPELMARMGGPEGATQSSLTGQVNASQSLYNMVRSYNRYQGRGQSDNVVGNMARFGQDMSMDPVGVQGLMAAGKGKNISQQFKEDGVMGLHDQIMHIARSQGLTTNGRLTAERAHQLMIGTMGMTNEEATAYMSEYASLKNPETRNARIAGMESENTKQTREYLERTGQTNLASKFSAPVKIYRDIREGVTGAMSRMLGGTGDLGDTVSNIWNEFQYGKKEDTMAKVSGADRSMVNLLDIDTIGKMGQSRGPLTEADRLRRRAGVGRGEQEESEFTGVGRQINKAAEAGNKHAIAALSKQSNASVVQDSLYKLAQEGTIDKKYTKTEDYQSLLGFFGQAPRQGSTLRTKDEDDYFSDLSELTPLMKGAAGKVGGKGYSDPGPLEQQAFVSASGVLSEALSKGEMLNQSSDKKVQKALEIFRRYSRGKTGNEQELEQSLSAVRKVANDKRFYTNPSDEFTGKSVDEHLADAEKSGQSQKEYLTGMIDRGGFGMRKAGAVNKNINTRDEDIEEFGRQQEAYRDELGKISKAAKEGQIDVTTAYQLATGLKMDNAANTMLAAAKEFRAGVKEMNPEKPGTPINSANPKGLPNLITDVIPSMINGPGGSR